jgi:hypothetical protein
MLFRIFKIVKSICLFLIPDRQSHDFDTLEYSKKYFPSDLNELKKLNIENF